MAQASQHPEDKRKYPRIKTNLRGRYMLADRREFPCTIIDVALGGIALSGPERGEIGETIIVYMDQLGRVEGEVVRHLEDGFALQLTITTRATEKFARRLDELQAGNRLRKVPERRAEPRVKLDEEVAVFEPPKGMQCEIVDLSLTGAHIKIARRPPLGSLVQLGRVRGRVVRHSSQGVAIEFVDAKNDSTLSEQLTQIALPTKRPNHAAA
jgi:hypothetical protein